MAGVHPATFAGLPRGTTAPPKIGTGLQSGRVVILQWTRSIISCMPAIRVAALAPPVMSFVPS